jgi:hypothetical protein
MWGKQKRENRKVQGTRQEPIGNTVVSVSPLIDDRRVSILWGFPFPFTRKKSKNKAGMLLINKPLPFLESCQSWNVYENKIGYAKKLEYR